MFLISDLIFFDFSIVYEIEKVFGRLISVGISSELISCLIGLSDFVYF